MPVLQSAFVPPFIWGGAFILGGLLAPVEGGIEGMFKKIRHFAHFSVAFSKLFV